MGIKQAVDLARDRLSWGWLVAVLSSAGS